MPPNNAPHRFSVALIGSKGRMGTMLGDELLRAGCAVHGVDADACGLQEALATSRVVLLCVPASAMQRALETLAPHLEPRHLLMDVTSVKTLPMQWMEAAFSGPVIGSHPMFGPRHTREDRRVALVRGARATDEDAREAQELWERIACRYFWSGAQEHDAGAALSQSLNFTVSAAFFATLAGREGIEPYLTPSFTRHLEAARMHLTVDTAMFLEFSAYNPEFPAALDLYRQTFDQATQGALPDIAARAAVWYERYGRNKDSSCT